MKPAGSVAALSLGLFWWPQCARATTVNFDDVPMGTTAAAAYGAKGVFFSPRVVIATNIHATAPVPHSGTQLALQENGEFDDTPLSFDFTVPQTHIALYGCTFQLRSTGVLRIFDANRKLIAQDGPKTLPDGRCDTLFDLRSSSRNITHVEFSVNAANIGIDDLTFEGGAPAPPPQTILELHELFGSGGYRNPPYDTSNFDWAKNLCGGDTWLSGKNPRYEWTPILDGGKELEDSEVGISGLALNDHRSNDDVWFTHPFGNDLNFDIAPDREYTNLPAPIRSHDFNDPFGRDSSIRKAKEKFGLDVSNVLHEEMDEEFVQGLPVKEGDRVAVLGRWIVDCGHPDFASEIHPPLLYVAARAEGPNITHAYVNSRPFLVSQEFGDGGLYEHLLTFA